MTSIYLPKKVVKHSPGFSIDAGGTLAKVLYVDKKDAHLLNSDNDDETPVPLTVAHFSVNNMDDCFKFILENSHVETRGITELYLTGVQCAVEKAKIEKLFGLNYARHKAVEEIFHEKNDKLKRKMKQQEDDLKALVAGSVGKTDLIKDGVPNPEGTGDSTNSPNGKKEHKITYPFVMACLGSGNSFIMYDENRKISFVQGTYRGGKSLQGLGELLLGVQDFGQIIELAKKGDATAVHNTNEDVFSKLKDDKKSMYAMLTEISFRESEYEKNVAMSFGKVVGRSKDSFKNCDIARALLHHIVGDIAACATAACYMEKLDQLYFCGSFCNDELVRQELHEALEVRNQHAIFNKNLYRVNFEFLKNGDILGSLGAFLLGAEKNGGGST